VDGARRLIAALGDYLTDEKELLARRAELEVLGESVARLRDGIARLDKRIEQLD
jgi:ubiquinone biosynthesis protein UbiJ